MTKLFTQPIMDFAYTTLSYATIELNSNLVRRFVYTSISVVLFLLFASLKLFSFGFSFFSWVSGLWLTWFEGLHYSFIVASSFDSCTFITLIVICGVSSTIILFSTVYMLGDPRIYEFLLLLMIFVSSMLMLVSAVSYMWFISFWEAIGICSFSLISFWCMRLYAIRASLQAMLVNKVGDACMLIALVIYCSVMHGEDMLIFMLSWEQLMWLSCVIILGACSKSALGLFHYWLPYAMEGPTSVSALIHAATLVTAGLFLVIKIKFVLLSGVVCFIMLCLSFIGILMLALIAADQFDVKRLIAYSTLSQIAYMFATISLGAMSVSVVYILVHALFKSLMFMTSGAIIHGIYDQQDLRTASALAKPMPIALILCFLACLCMLGTAGTVGMYSKELIVELFGNSFKLEGWWLSQSLLVGLLATTLYSCVMLWGLFSGGNKGWSLPRSSDDIGVAVFAILIMQALALLTSGAFLADQIVNEPGGFGMLESSIDLSHVLGSVSTYNDYTYASIVLLTAVGLRLEWGRLASLRLHALKWLYDRSLNTLILFIHESVMGIRSDLLRVVFFIRYSLFSSITLSALRVTFVRVIVWLVIVVIILV